MKTGLNRRAPIAVVALMTAVLAACGDDSDAADDTTATTTTAPDTETTVAADERDAEWDAIVAAAEQEGQVTLYSSQGVDQLNAFEAAFEAEYPAIDLTQVRMTDNDSTARVDVEHTTGLMADAWVINSQATMQAKADEGGWFVEPAGQSFEAEDYLDEYSHDGGYFEVGAAVLTFAWNTDAVAGGLADYEDLLDPELAGGRIATIDASVSPAAVDFYLFLEENYGREFVEALAAQDPRLYPSALPIGEALGSGEVAAAAFALPPIAAQAAGAPVDFAIADQAWGTRFFGSILDGGPHPNAAQVLMDFMVSPAGQEAVQAGQGSVLPDIPGTLTTNDRIRVQDLAALTPERVAEYLQDWDALFR